MSDITKSSQLNIKADNCVIIYVMGETLTFAATQQLTIKGINFFLTFAAYWWSEKMFILINIIVTYDAMTCAVGTGLRRSLVSTKPMLVFLSLLLFYPVFCYMTVILKSIVSGLVLYIATETVFLGYRTVQCSVYSTLYSILYHFICQILSRSPKN